MVTIGGTIAEQLRFGTQLPRARRIARRQREQAATRIRIVRRELEISRERFRERDIRRGIQEKVILQLEREAQGKRGTILDTAEERALRNRLARIPSIKRAIERGVGVRGIALGLGISAKQRQEITTEILAGRDVVGIRGVQSLPSGEIVLERGQVFDPSAFTISQPLRDTDLITVEPSRLEAPVLQSFGMPTPEAQFVQPLSTVTAVDRPSGRLEGALFDIRGDVSTLQTKELRGGLSGFGQARLLGLATVGTIVGGISSLKQIITHPFETVKSLPQLPSALKREAKIFGITARESPATATGQVLGSLIFLKGTSKAISLTGRGLELGRTVISPKFKPVTTRDLTQFGTTEQFIGGISEIGGVGEIGLIPAGLERAAPTLRPTVRGGFGFTAKEQAKFVGELGPIVTAQRGFKGFDIRLQKELFATPPLAGRGFVRVSRLGVTQPKATLRDIISGDITFKRQKPQIIVFPKEVVGRRGGFQPQLRGTELETVLPPGRIPVKTGVPGVTIIGKRRVPIITAQIGATTQDISKLFGRARAGEGLSIGEIRKLRKVTGFDISSTLGMRPFISPTKALTSTGLSISKQLRLSTRLTAKSLGISFPTRVVPSGKISPFAPITPGITPGISPPISPGISPPISPPLLPPVSPPFPPPFGPSFPPPPPVRRTADRRKAKKKPKVRRELEFPISVSFTAVAADLFGKFPKVRIKGLGLTPEQIRFQPLHRPKRRPSLAGVRARRTRRRKRRR